ncbi:MAG: energy transducer TonB [Verrucomicrobiota bacterium]
MVPSVTGEAAVHDYPAEKIYAPWGMFASVAFHLTIVGIVIWLAYENHIRSLRDMMTAAIVDQPPQQLEVLLIDDKKEPPPTDHPLWIKELLIPKVKPPPPPPKPKPKPKPVVARAVPKLVPGTHSLPRPSYPLEAYENHIQGTVRLRVAFDGTGNVIDAEVVDSSGSSVLDSETRHFILSNWHDPDFAGQVQEVPIQYVLPK